MASILDDIKKQFTSKSVLTRLIIVNVVVWLLMIIASITVGRLMGEELLNKTLAIQGYYLGVPSDLGLLIRRPWTIITHMFAHDTSGIMHLAFNMLGLYFLGQLWIQFVGVRKLLPTYILGGWAGMLLYVVIYNVFPGLQTMSFAVGASAAVYAIMTAAAAYRPNMQIRLFGILPVKLGLMVGIFILGDFLRLNSGDNFGGHLAHIGGAAFGFVYGRQLLQGKDSFRWMDRFLDRFFNFFKFGGTRMRVVRDTPHKRPKSDEQFNQERNNNQQKVDRILDKISRSGYDSLTKDEKDFLFRQGK